MMKLEELKNEIRKILKEFSAQTSEEKFQLEDIKEVENMEDFHKKDGTTVEKHTYSKNNSNTQVIHFKLVKGGHLWLGSPIADWLTLRIFFGRNNHEINSSKEIVDFFLKYKLSDFN